MCCEQPLSRYQSSSLAFKHTYKTIDQTFLALTLNLDPMLVETIFCGLVPFGTRMILVFGFLRGHE